MKRIAIAWTCAGLILSGCASTGGSMPSMANLPKFPTASTSQGPSWVPQIDNAKVNQAKYARDYAECKAFADTDPTTNAVAETKKGFAKYGLAGLAVGGAIVLASGGLAAPAILPAMAGSVAAAGGAGALGGAMNARETAAAKYRNIVATCLQGRGYTVLN